MNKHIKILWFEYNRVDDISVFYVDTYQLYARVGNLIGFLDGRISIDFRSRD